MNKVIQLTSDTLSIQYLCEVDKRFKAVYSMVGDLSYRPYDDSYAFLVNQIVGQMLSNKVARIIFKRVEALCGGSVRPEAIDQLSDDQIRSTGLARSKVSFIRELTKAVNEKKIVFADLKGLDDTKVLHELTSIKGIGTWSAKMYLIFVLDRQDVLPYEDAAFLQGFGWAYNTNDYSRLSVENRCKRWRPYSSIAARYMYRALDLGLTKRSFGDAYLEGYEYLSRIRDYLQSVGVDCDRNTLLKEITLRKEGKVYGIKDHIRSMIYAMLSNQTKWYRIEPHLSEIDQLFYGYEPEKIKETNPDYFANKMFDMKCGNMSTKAQMRALKDNIQTFCRIENEFGSIDAFITSAPTISIVEKLSDGASSYKLKMLGEALVWEYLKRVGIDAVKPDTHLRRFLGAERMGIGVDCIATIGSVNEQVEIMTKETGMTKTEIDFLIWSFCADGYGAICTSAPHCSICPIKCWCRMS